MTGGIIITKIEPQLDDGKFPAKKVQGDLALVSADIFSYGSEKLRARIKYKAAGERRWRFSGMEQAGNDRWEGGFTIEEPEDYKFSVEAWVDEFGTWLNNIMKWYQAAEDVSQDLKVGIEILQKITKSSTGRDRKRLEKLLSTASWGTEEEAIIALSGREVEELVIRCQTKQRLTSSGRQLTIQVERKNAGFASWYELFPRSQGRTPGKPGTFSNVIDRLDDISDMGFDVIYLPPIHPIGKTNRRGKDGFTQAKPDDPGSPWAIGNEEGGHKSIDSGLGTMDDFKRLIRETKKRKMEVALDIAFQCSPDHPYVMEHPEWFYQRPDGTIRYAENPPKKYYDIYPLNFETQNRRSLYSELLSIFLFWAHAGVRIFRVDNPHTKPFDFWEWVIREVKKEYPDVIFLSEAFTRPKVMYHLSKIGFSQSYTYFTWRNYDWEIRDYFTELSRRDVSDHFRPMLFTNTPDILPFVLQRGGRAAFKLRAVLAATLSPLWGIYSGFELCENLGVPGREEYLNSEKYEIKVRDWDARGNIKQLIKVLNTIRKSEESLQENGNVVFQSVNNPNIVFYTRTSVKTGRTLMIAVNINPYEIQEGTVRVPLEEIGICSEEPYRVRDLITGDIYTWQGERNYVRLIPDERPAHIMEVVE